jgi:hypothetical protein
MLGSNAAAGISSMSSSELLTVFAHAAAVATDAAAATAAAAPAAVAAVAAAVAATAVPLNQVHA